MHIPPPSMVETLASILNKRSVRQAGAEVRSLPYICNFGSCQNALITKPYMQFVGRPTTVIAPRAQAYLQSRHPRPFAAMCCPEAIGRPLAPIPAFCPPAPGAPPGTGPASADAHPAPMTTDPWPSARTPPPVHAPTPTRGHLGLPRPLPPGGATGQRRRPPPAPRLPCVCALPGPLTPFTPACSPTAQQRPATPPLPWPG